jgi:outer membrane lipoprotein-sorting protein
MPDMRRVVSMSAVLVLPMLCPAQGQAQSVPPSWLESLMARMAAIPERRESFQEEKQFAALDKPLNSSGQLVYRRPAYLEKITTSPDPESLIVDGDRLTLTSADRKTHSFQVDRRPEVSALVDAVRGTLAGNLQLLETRFSVQTQGSAGDWTLILTPRESEVHQWVQDIVVSGQGTYVHSFRITQTNHNQQIMTISEAR